MRLFGSTAWSNLNRWLRPQPSVTPEPEPVQVCEARRTRWSVPGRKTGLDWTWFAQTISLHHVAPDRSLTRPRRKQIAWPELFALWCDWVATRSKWHCKKVVRGVAPWIRKSALILNFRFFVVSISCQCFGKGPRNMTLVLVIVLLSTILRCW